MKFHIRLSFILFLSIQAYGQFGFPNNINLDAQYIRGIYSADLDGDGDLDIITGSVTTDSIEWYENIDGLGNFGPLRLITTQTDQTRSVFVVDIDNDNDNDIVSASWGDNKIAWYENLDGLGNFGPQQIISTNAIAANSVKASDLDGDGDPDIVAACIADKITWYENTDGLGNFGAEQIISTNVDFATEVYYADIDGDFDSDIISISVADNKIAWYENIDGAGNFGPQNVIYILPGLSKPTAAMIGDFDGDGDLDIAYSSDTYQSPHFGWLENTDGLGTFVYAQLINTSLQIMPNGIVMDIENDGDLDIVTAGYDTSSSSIKLSWYPNNGSGFFGAKIDVMESSEEVWDIVAANLNDDNHTDVIIGTNSQLKWVENTGEIILNNSDQNINNFRVYPNPTFGTMLISHKRPIESIIIFSSQGRYLSQFYNQNEINIAILNSGLYFLRIEDAEGEVQMKKIIKR